VIAGSLRRRLAIQAAITLGFVALLLWRIDPAETVRRLAQVDPRWLAAALVALTLSRLLQAYRWRLCMWRQRRLPAGQVLGIYLVSALVNVLAPLRTGDVLRVYMAGRRFGVRRTELVAGVFVVESLMNWTTALLVVLAALVVIDLPPQISSLPVALAVLIAVVGAAALALQRLERLGDTAQRIPVRWLPGRARGGAASLISRFVYGLEALRRPAVAARAIAVSALIWGFELTFYWCMGQAFGLPLAFADYVLVMIGANLVLSLPLTPMNIGPFALAVTEMLVLLRVDRATAAGYTIGAHLALVAWLGVLGLTASWFLGVDLRRLWTRPDDGGAPPEERSAVPSGRIKD
jgi:glycosyltransferase 2 family protein